MQIFLQLFGDLSSIDIDDKITIDVCTGLELLGRLWRVDVLSVTMDRTVVVILALDTLPDARPVLLGDEAVGALVHTLVVVDLVHGLGLGVHGVHGEAKDLALAALVLGDAHPLLVGHQRPGTGGQAGEAQGVGGVLVPGVVAGNAGPRVVDGLLRVLAASDTLGVARPPLLALVVTVAHLLVLVVGSSGARDQFSLAIRAAPAVGTFRRTFVQTLVGLLVVNHHDVGVLVRLPDHDLLPVDGVHVAEQGVLLDPDPAVHDVREAGEADPDHPLGLVDSQGVRVDQLMTSDHGQPRKQGLEAVYLLRPIQNHIVRDLHQVGQRIVAGVVRVRVRHLVDGGGDGDVALHHGAVLVLPQAVHADHAPARIVLVVDHDAAS